MKIAMWSGPRNLSTALMYSFANRSDMCVVDEPFYASYLVKTGLEHPMREAIIASQNTNADVVIDALMTEDHVNHHYHKHMTQHMLPHVSRDWLSNVTSVFLIRHPARVLASWTHKHDRLSLTEIGFVQQLELFEQVEALGQDAIVIDSADIRADPETALRALCDAIGLPWDPAMLAWKKGAKPYDGVWADHWYDAVHHSTGFAGAEGNLPILNAKLEAVNKKALPLYERLAAHKLSI